jgi:hypothetical protein
LAGLIDDLLTDEEKARAKKLLRRHGISCDDLQSLFICVLAQCGSLLVQPEKKC